MRGIIKIGEEMIGISNRLWFLNFSVLYPEGWWMPYDIETHLGIVYPPELVIYTN